MGNAANVWELIGLSLSMCGMETTTHHLGHLRVRMRLVVRADVSCQNECAVGLAVRERRPRVRAVRVYPVRCTTYR